MTVKAISPKQSDTISLDDLKPLLAPRRGPCATLCLPTMRQGREQVQNSIRFKNLLRQLEDELGSGNSQARQTLEEMLGPARERLDDQDFWQHQSEGLAVYLAPGFSAWLRLPVETPELMTIGERFDLWPLLPALSHGERFFVLTLAQGGAKLWRCGRRTIAEVPLPEDTPTSLPEVLKFYDFEKSGQHHSDHGRAVASGTSGSIHHGHGQAGDDANNKKLIDEFFKQLDHGVRERLESFAVKPPLILAGVEFIQGHYRDLNKWPNLLPQGIDCHPHDLRPEQLQERAWEIARPIFEQETAAQLDRFNLLRAKDGHKTQTDLDRIAQDARDARVDVLFVANASGAAAGSNANKVGAAESKGSAVEEGLLAEAIAETLANGGRIFPLSSEQMPGLGRVAAIMRF